MGEAARKFLDRLVLRVGGTASERARYRRYAEQRLACVGKPWDQPTKARHNPSRLRPKKTREVALEREK